MAACFQKYHLVHSSGLGFRKTYIVALKLWQLAYHLLHPSGLGFRKSYIFCSQAIMATCLEIFLTCPIIFSFLTSALGTKTRNLELLNSLCDLPGRLQRLPKSSSGYRSLPVFSPTDRFSTSPQLQALFKCLKLSFTSCPMLYFLL
jgi:hypothetical protein